jgi:nicotinamidase-related amidase
MIRHPNILKRGNSALLVVDVQQKIVPVINNMELVEKNIIRLIKGCQLLNVPIFYTEQYPKGLGRTIDSIVALLAKSKPIEKMHFSVCCSKELIQPLRDAGFSQIVIVGIEAHICISQSTLDLVQEGFQVHVVEDAIGSRNEKNKKNALLRMNNLDVTITTTEAALFELIEVAGTDDFRKISQLIK